MMKILHVLDHSLPYFSGYSFRSKAILDNQKSQGWNVVVVTSPKHEKIPSAKESIEGVEYHRTRMPDGRVYRPFAARSFSKEYLLVNALTKAIVRICREEPVRLIHAHSPSLNGLAAIRAGKMMGIPVVYEIRAFWEDAAVDHGTYVEDSLKYRISRRVETFVLKRADAVVTICEGLRKEIISRGLPPSKIVVAGNGVDLEFFSPRPKSQSLMRKLGIEGKTVVGFIGSFYYYEGLDLLLKAFSHTVRDFPDTVLLLAGDGKSRGSLEELRRNLKLTEGSVRFLGNVPHPEVPHYYSIMDILAYPRKQMRLTDLVTPLKPLEAMAMEKAVVGSDVGGIAELVENGMTGLLFESGNPEKLADALNYMLSKPSERESFGRRGRLMVCEKRDWRIIARNYTDLYNSLLKSSPK